MSRSDAGLDIDTVVLNVYDADGFLGLQVGTEGSESIGGQAPVGGAHDYETHQPAGIYHSPLNAVLDGSGNVDPKQACQSITYREGGHVVVIPTTDPRVIPLLPTMNPGDTCVYGGAGAFYRVTGPGNNQGRHSMWTTDSGDVAGNTVALRCWPDRHQRSAPWGTETFDYSGYHLATSAGPCFDMGGMSGPLVPPGYGSYGLQRADSWKIDAKTVQLGPSGDYIPVVLSTPLETQLAAIIASQQETIETLQAVLDTLSVSASTIAFAATALAAATATSLTWTAAYGTGSSVSPDAFTAIATASTAIVAACLASDAPLIDAIALGTTFVSIPNDTDHPLCSKSTAAT